MGRVRLADRLGDPWLILLLNLPALVVIVLAYIWAGLTEAAAIAAIAINKLPTAVVTLREGTRALDPALDEMATVFATFRAAGRSGTSFCRSSSPYIAAAARSGLALIWKIVLVAELLGTSERRRLRDRRGLPAVRHPAPARLFAELRRGRASSIETVLVQPFEARLSRWRPRAA